jgi:KDO2-lipid IV(A) lauroyltransferase
MMNTVLYYLTLPFIFLLSHLPMKALYLLSDLLYLFLYRVFGYRKSVVIKNLTNAFPDKTKAEIDQLCRDFYHYLCDLSLEIIKAFTISPAAVERFFTYREEDLALLRRLYEKKKSIILVLGHMGNWELVGAFFGQAGLHPLYVIYHPLAHPQFDRLFKNMRLRNGMKLYRMKETYKQMVRNKDKLTATAFVGDQTPRPDNAHWMTFLNQDTGVFKGTEKAAKMFDYPVVYASVVRQKRGLYRVSAEMLAEHPKQFGENELTELHTRRLERDILAHPHTWLWSHRRWKHKRPEQTTET